MRYYETIVIIHPALESGHLKDNIVDIQKLVERKGGSLRNTEVWGRKKLAYLIEKQKYGTYVLFQYEGETIRINEMNEELEHNPNFLAYMTVRIEESGLREQPGDLETQIAGHSAPPAEESATPAQKAPSDTEEASSEAETENSENEAPAETPETEVETPAEPAAEEVTEAVEN